MTLSSLNRHATAVLSDVGTPKVQCIKRTLKSIASWITVESCVDVWKKEEGGKYLHDVDWVIGWVFATCYVLDLTCPLDAIDNIGTKVDLLAYCHSNNIKVRRCKRAVPQLKVYRQVFSSMGAGAKSDPTRIQIRSSKLLPPPARF